MKVDNCTTNLPGTIIITIEIYYKYYLYVKNVKTWHVPTPFITYEPAIDSTWETFKQPKCLNFWSKGARKESYWKSLNKTVINVSYYAQYLSKYAYVWLFTYSHHSISFNLT